MEERFGRNQIFVSELLKLAPSLLCDEINASFSFDDVSEFSHSDLPNPVVIDTEISSWKRKWK